MKAFITVVDDNDRLFCKDHIIYPVKEEIVGKECGQYPIMEIRFNFTIRQLVIPKIEPIPTDLSDRKELGTTVTHPLKGGKENK